MTIIWLIETDEQSSDGVYDRLASEFPVRRIASIESLRSIYAIEAESRRPHLIIAKEPPCGDRMKILAGAHILQGLSEKCTVATTADSIQTWQEVTLNLGIPRINFNFADGFSLKAQIDLLLSLCPQSSPTCKVKKSESELIAIGDLFYNPKRNTIKIHGATTENLPPKEAKIFELLASAPNSCVSRISLAELVWPGVTVSDRTLDSHVSRLRRKLEASFECGIESVYGEGYKLKVNG